MPELPTGTVEAWEVLDLLTSLVEKSIVVFEEQEGEGRYRLLETVRQYGRDRLLEAGEAEALRGRHRGWFLALAEEAEPHLYEGAEQVAWMDRLEREHDNLRAALVWTVAQGQGGVGLRLGGALGHFWYVQGYLGEGREHLAGMLALPGAEARTAARAKALHGAGTMARLQGDYGTAQALNEESLAICRELGDRRGIAGSLNDLGIAAREQGDYGAARALYEESLAIFRELGHKPGVAWTLDHLGWVAHCQGESGRAQALHEEGLAIFRELGDKTGIAWPLCGLGSVVLSQGDYGAARALYEESLAIFRELGDKEGIVWDLEGLAAVAVAQGQSERAARLFYVAEGLRRAIGAPLPPADRAEHDRSVAAVRAALGEEAFAAAWAEGQAMSLEQATDYALEEPADA